MADEKCDIAGGRDNKSLPIEVILNSKTDVETILGDKEKMREFWYSLRLMREMVNLDETESNGNENLISLVDENRAKVVDEIDTVYASRPMVAEEIIERANQMYNIWNREKFQLTEQERLVTMFSPIGVSILSDAVRCFEKHGEFVGLARMENPFAAIARNTKRLKQSDLTVKFAELAEKVMSPYLFGMSEVEGGVAKIAYGKFRSN